MQRVRYMSSQRALNQVNVQPLIIEPCVSKFNIYGNKKIIV